MKDSTYEKISNLAAKMRRVEPQWYLGWALGCALVGGLLGDMSFIIVGVMYLFLAEMARQRNTANRRADAWQDLTFRWREQSDAWRGLSDAWKEAYCTEPRPQDKP